MLRSPLRDLFGVLVLLAFALPAYAVQARAVLGTTVNFTGGGRNRIQNPSSTTTTPATANNNTLANAFYGVYPSLSLTTMGRSSSLSANYGFGYNRTAGSRALPTGSHTASLNYAAMLGPRWTAKVTDTFRETDGLGTFGVLSGVPQQATSSTFSFQSVGGRRLPRTNNANAGLSWAMDANSTVSFTASHSIRTYGGGTPTSSLVSDQQQLSGRMAFQQLTGPTESWTLSYGATYFDYGRSQISLTQTAQADYSKGIGRHFALQIGSGISAVNTHGTSGGKLNYDAIFGLSTNAVLSNSFSLVFSQSSTDRVGLGSSSLTRRGSLNWNRPMGKLTTSAAISAYDSRGNLSNTARVRGGIGVANISIALTGSLSFSGSAHYQTTKNASSSGFSQRRVFYSSSLALALSSTLSLSGGATYDDSSQSGILNFSQRRVFLSLRYSEPNLINLH